MMKKMMMLMGVSLLLILSACAGESGPSAQEALQEAFDSFTLFEQPITGDIQLPNEVNGISVTWDSQNPSVLSNDGVVNRPEFGSNDERVEIVGVFEKDGERLSATYFVEVLSVTEEEIRDELETLVMGLDFLQEDVLTRQPTLPAPIDGVRFTFRSLTPDVLTNSVGFLKNPVGGETIDAQLRITAIHPSRIIQAFEVPLTIGTWEALEIASQRNVEFVPIEGEFIVPEGFMNIYTMNNDLPYVNPREFLNTISGAVVYSSLDFEVDGNTWTVSITSEPDEDDEDDEPVTYYLTFDFDNNTATTNYYSFFGAIGNSTQTDFGRGLEFIDFESNFDEIEPVTFDLGLYNLELYQGSEGFLIPFHLANLFLSGSVYDVYYNGDVLYGRDIYEFGQAISLYHDSSLNGEPIPANLKEMTYHFTAFALDYFFGLKTTFEIDGFYDVLANYKSQLLGTDEEHYRAFLDFVLDLDDLHTSHRLTGPYSTSASYSLSLTDLGPRGQRFYEALFNDLDDSRLCNDDDGVVYLDGDTVALINIGGFTDEATQMMAEVMAEIDSKPSIEKIVVNLACNSGGIIGTAWQILGYLTDSPLDYYSLNRGDGLESRSTFTSETSANRDVDWYILTSPITYSAANLFASMARDMNLATIVGTRSSGGAASIKPIMLPNGTIIFISSPNVLANNNFEDIEFGIPVDISISTSILGNDNLNLDAIVDAIRNQD